MCMLWTMKPEEKQAFSSYSILYRYIYSEQKKKMKNLLQLAFLYGEGIRNLDFGEGFLSEIIKGIW